MSAEELVTLVRDYGDAAWKRIEVDIPERYGLGAVLGVFLSILHPKLRNHTESEIRLVSARDQSNEITTLLVNRGKRDDIRNVMERFGIDGFELPINTEGAGASERKDGNEIDDLELEREDGKRILTIAIDTGMVMRLI